MVRSGVSLCAPLLVNIIAFDQERCQGSQSREHSVFDSFAMYFFQRRLSSHVQKQAINDVSWSQSRSKNKQFMHWPPFSVK